MTSEQDLLVYKQCILELNNVSINYRNIDKLTSQNLSDIKKERPEIYMESLVRLQCEAKKG